MTALSARLDAIVALVAPCRMLADVGTDHGLLPIAVVTRGLAKHAIAADLRAGPLRYARRNVEAAGACADVTLVQGDGLGALASYPLVDAVTMAGVSGALMVTLCGAAAAADVLARIVQIVVQPNSEAHVFRAWAGAHGWHLTGECMVEDGGRFFVVCAFKKGRGHDPAYAVRDWSATDLAVVGPLLLASKHDVARRWYHLQRDRIQGLVDKGAPGLDAELVLWQSACDAVQR